jgi:hypothetical protein
MPDPWTARVAASTAWPEEVACAPCRSRKFIVGCRNRDERFFAGDPLTRARALAAIYPKREAMARALAFMRQDE